MRESSELNRSKEKSKRIKLWLLILSCLSLIIPIIWLMVVRLEGKAPVIRVELLSPMIGISKEVSITVSDSGTGIKKIWIGLIKDGKDIVLEYRILPSAGIFKGGKVHKETLTILIEPKDLGLTDGKATLRILARDYSWRKNKTYLTKDVIIDTSPPEIEVLSSNHNISQGGAGLVIYRLSEANASSGVHVGDNFFPGHSGYFHDSGLYLAFFALDYRQGPDTEIYVKATDQAGNQVRSGLYYYIKRKVFKKDGITISDRFLSWKVPEFNIGSTGAGSSLVDKFLIINRDIRKSNFTTLTDIGQHTENVLYWKGPFLRLKGSATKAEFADHRTYTYNGREIDKQVHLGIDLASVSHSPVPASNRGKVVLAENVGIFGKTVILDHGFGLYSTYSHLSSMDVQVGNVMSKGDILGRTGTTGLAGGDHLHYGMFIHNTFVNPIEWWDASWIKNNITSKMDELSKSR